MTAQRYTLRGYFGHAIVHKRGTFREVWWRNRWTHEIGSHIVEGAWPAADYAAFCVARRFVDGGARPDQAPS